MTLSKKDLKNNLFKKRHGLTLKEIKRDSKYYLDFDDMMVYNINKVKLHSENILEFISGNCSFKHLVSCYNYYHAVEIEYVPKAYIPVFESMEDVISEINEWIKQKTTVYKSSKTMMNNSLFRRKTFCITH